MYLHSYTQINDMGGRKELTGLTRENIEEKKFHAFPSECAAITHAQAMPVS